MGFEQGRKKTGGRGPSTPNRRTAQLAEILQAHGYDPVAELIEWAIVAKERYKTEAELAKAIMSHALASGRRPPDMVEAHQWARLGLQASIGILPYLYPKRKPQEGVSAVTPEQAQSMSNDELVSQAEQMIQAYKGGMEQ